MSDDFDIFEPCFEFGGWWNPANWLVLALTLILSLIPGMIGYGVATAFVVGVPTLVVVELLGLPVLVADVVIGVAVVCVSVSLVAALISDSRRARAHKASTRQGF